MKLTKTVLAACTVMAVSLGAAVAPASAKPMHHERMMMHHHNHMMMHHKMMMRHHTKMMMHHRMMHKM